MKYKLIDDHRSIRRKFTERFVATYSEFANSHEDWISKLHTEFTESYFDKMFMWDKLRSKAQNILFDDAIAFLRGLHQNMFFLAESPNCAIREFCELNNRNEYVAVTEAVELADCAAFEWYTEYELAEQGRYLANPILPSDLYVFDDSFSWCLILTHETDETESAASRVCLYCGQQ